MKAVLVVLVAFLLALALGKVAIPVTEQDAGSQEYMVGVGKADVTGPAAEGLLYYSYNIIYILIVVK